MKEKVLARINTLTPLLLAYPKSGMAAEHIEVYAQALTVVSVQVLQAAVFKCLRTYKFFPSISEIMEQAEALAETMQGKDRLSADEAWHQVMREVKTKANFLAPSFEDENVAEATKLFGWGELHMIREHEVGIARAQFKKIYEGVCGRRKERLLNQQLIGSAPDTLNSLVAGTLPSLTFDEH